MGLANNLALQYRLDSIMNCPLSQDRRSKTRLVEDAWQDLAPLIDAGYPLKDIWIEKNEWGLSYRQFARIVAQIRGVSGRIRRKRVLPPSPAASPRTSIQNGREFNPFKNLDDHDARTKHEYPGTLPAEKLI